MTKISYISYNMGHRKREKNKFFMKTKNVDPEGSSIRVPQVESEEKFFAQLIVDPNYFREQILLTMDESEVFRFYDYLVRKEEELQEGTLQVREPERLKALISRAIISLQDYPGMDEHKEELRAKKEEIEAISDLLDNRQWDKRHPLLKKNKTIRKFARKIIK